MPVSPVSNPEQEPTRRPHNDEHDRRRESRDPVHVQLEVAEEDGTRELGTERGDLHQAWACNVSESGICFCSSTPIRPGRIRVRGNQEGPWIGMEIVRCRKLSSEHWEYGGVRCSSDCNVSFEIPQREFVELHSRLSESAGNDNADSNADSDRLHPAMSEDTPERNMMLSLRRVANWSIELESLEVRWLTHRRVSSLIKLFILAFAIFFLVQAPSGAIDSSMSWWALAALMAILLMADWRVSRRLRKLRDTPPEQS